MKKTTEQQQNMGRLGTGFPKWAAWFVLLVIVVQQIGCKSPNPCGRTDYAQQRLSQRLGVYSDSTPPDQECIPRSVALEDGLSESEAVTIALSNNSAFQATLAQLGMASGDALQASLLANPQILLYFPSGAKEGQATLYAPIESYLLRPARVRAANKEYHRVGEQLVQNGLNLARDVRIAYADYASAIERLQLARDANRIRHEFADLTYKRFKDGDISELETITSRVDALSSDAAIAAEEYNVSIAKARLQTSMGIPSYAGNLVPNPLTTLPLPEIDDEELLQIALTCRPDYQGAQWLVSAAEERTRLARWQFLRFDGVADTRYNSDHVRTGTGLRFDLPLFNRNQGGVVRTDWELNAAAHNRDAIRDQIHQEVRVATQQTSQARSNLQIIENSVLPKLSEAITLAQKGFADGGTDYLLVLQTTTQYLDARSRLITERTNLQRAIAELERSISRPLSESPLEESWGESSGGSIAEPHNKSPER